MLCIAVISLHGQHPNRFQRSIDSLEVLLKSESSTLGQINLLTSISTGHLRKNEYFKAKEYADKALIISDSLQNEKGKGMALVQLAYVYWHLGDSETSKVFNLKGLKINSAIGDPSMLAQNYVQLTHSYCDLKLYDSAIIYNDKARLIHQQLKDVRAVAKDLDLKGYIYVNTNEFELGEKYLFEAMDLAQELKDTALIAGISDDISSLYEKQGDIPKALKYANNGLRLFTAVNYQRGVHEALIHLEKAHLRDRNFEEAYAVRLKIDDLKINLTRIQTLAKFKELQLSGEFEESKLEQEKKESQNRIIRNFIAALFLIASGFLLVTFRQSRKIRQQKNRSDDLLLNILPADIAEELKINGKAEARKFEKVTVLFTDFKEFTQISAGMDAKELVFEVNACFEKFDQICEKYHVEKIKTIGDAYMAAGGITSRQNNSVKNTVLAALEMQQFIMARNLEHKKLGIPSFEMRVGIHTGPIVAGIVGVKKFQYDMWGDTVNTAARLETSCVEGRVNVSSIVRNILVKDSDFQFEFRGEKNIKGKGNIEMWFVEFA